MAKFYVCSKLSDSANKLKNICGVVEHTVREVESITSGLGGIGLGELNGAFAMLKGRLDLEKKHCINLSETLIKIITLYKNTENGIVAFSGNSVGENSIDLGNLGEETATEKNDSSDSSDDVNPDDMDYYDYIDYRAENACDETTRLMYEKYLDNLKITDDDYSGTARYNDFFNDIKLDISDDDTNVRGRGCTYFHEFGHLIDDQSDWNDQTSNDWSYEFGDKLEEDFNNYVDKVMEENGFTDKQDAYDYISDWLNEDGDMKNGLSDICCGLSDGDVCGGWAHDDDYYSDSKIENEAFAHFFEAGMYTDSTKLDYIKEMFPSAYAEFHQMLEDDLE